jgi:hypothetical protein
MSQFGLANKVDHTINWNWETQHVDQAYDSENQKSKEVSVYDIIESGTVLIAAGPASLTAAVSNDERSFRLVPIGLVETATVAMSKPLSRIFEIGSKLSYIIPGRTVGQIALARVLFDGPSLLKVLYQGEVISDSQNSTGTKQALFASGNELTRAAAIGSGNVAINLASSFFDQPIGLGFFFKDRSDEMVSQIYFEGCRVSTHNLGIAANMNVLTESVSMEFVQCVPIISLGSSASTTKDVAGGLKDIPIIGGGTPTE